jgi:hypothetical protein
MASGQSWSLLTMHKSGSAFVGEILTTIYAANGFETHDLCTVAFEQGTSELEYIRSRSNLFMRDGCFFGPFRDDTCEYVGLMEQIRPILHVRDPRDGLVSLYYSLAYSHPLPGPGPMRDSFLTERAAFQALSVDGFANQVLDWYLLAVGALRSIASRRTDHILSRYEDMVTQFPQWLDRILLATRLQISPELRRNILAMGTFEVTEDKYRHKRQVTPGDFRRKLSTEMQGRLTDAFAADLLFFGYAL